MQKYTGIGLMSGTSLDGLDIALCEFEFHNKKVCAYSILHAKTLDFPLRLKERLENCMPLGGADLNSLHNDFGIWLGESCLSFIEHHGITPDFISSHGHTVFHDPSMKQTLQIGNGNMIHAITGIPVVFDFRSLDVALGGQGAPLVPVGDAELFPEFQICMNVGGFANVSFDNGTSRKAYDIGATNIVINSLVKNLNQKYDQDGKIARSGRAINDLARSLDSLKYYKMPFPKSLGREWVENMVFPVIHSYKNQRLEDIIHTYTIHIATRIARDLNILKERYFNHSECRILVTGGGTYNTFLIENIKEQLIQGCQLHIPENSIVDYKEALIFAFLGLLRIQGLKNCLHSVTGASRDSCGGAVIGKVDFKHMNDSAG